MARRSWMHTWARRGPETEIFGDELMAAVLIDRLVHRWHIVRIRGNSATQTGG